MTDPVSMKVGRQTGRQMVSTSGTHTLKFLRRKNTGQHEMQDEVIKAKKLWNGEKVVTGMNNGQSGTDFTKHEAGFTNQ